MKSSGGTQRSRRFNVNSMVMCVCAVVLAVCLYVLAKTYMHIEAMKLSCKDRMPPEEFLKHLNAGDIIFTAHSKCSWLTKAINTFTGTNYYHVGIVVVIDGKKWLLHYTDPRYAYFYKPVFLCKDQGVSDMCISDLADICQEWTDYGTYVLIAPYDGQFNSDMLIAKAKEIGCGKPYDGKFMWTYITSKYNVAPKALNCNTFIGLLLEEMGELAKSPHPVRDYIPGRLWQRILHDAPHYKNKATYCLHVGN